MFGESIKSYYKAGRSAGRRFCTLFKCVMHPTSFPGPFPWRGGGAEKGPWNEVGCNTLLPPHPQAREKVLGTRLYCTILMEMRGREIRFNPSQ